MKILLVGNYAVDQQASMLGFVGALLSGLCGRGIEARIVAPQPIIGKLPIKSSGVAKWLGYGDKYLLFPSMLRHAAKWADVIHICDQGNASYVPYVQKLPHIVTCHDMLAIMSAQGKLKEWSTGKSGQLYQQMIFNGLNRAGFVACVSEATRRDLLDISRIRMDQTQVIYNGLYRPCVRMPQEEANDLLQKVGIADDEPFLLHVGGNQLYKNRLGMLKIYNELRRHPNVGPMRLVMAGKPFSGEMRDYVAAQKLEQTVLERCDLDDEHIRALYSRTKALIFPSLYEGFGLPIIEAQSCGCPVFTSNRAPMTEVGGKAAIYFDPTEPQEAANIIAGHLGVTANSIAAGYENVRRFSTDRMLDEYISLYETLIR